ncbi:MAG: hypothetical protein ACI8RD_000538 [Bacillariaceae sp.]|jgi:hypothetical protein
MFGGPSQTPFGSPAGGGGFGQPSAPGGFGSPAPAPFGQAPAGGGGGFGGNCTFYLFYITLFLLLINYSNYFYFCVSIDVIGDGVNMFICTVLTHFIIAHFMCSFLTTCTLNFHITTMTMKK